jgi:hypothetical protein
MTYQDKQFRAATNLGVDEWHMVERSLALCRDHVPLAAGVGWGIVVTLV